MNVLCMLNAKLPSLWSFMTIMSCTYHFKNLQPLLYPTSGPDQLCISIIMVILKKKLARQYRFNLIWYFNVRKADNCEYRTYAQIQHVY